MENREIRILFADDDFFVRSVMGSVIESHGWRAILASNGKEAYEAYQESYPNVIVLDVAMPVMSGFEVAQLIRKSDSQTPILFYSALADEKFLIQALKFGGRFYITKNYSEELLVSYIETLLPQNTRWFELADGVKYDSQNSILIKYGEEVRISGIQARLMNILCDNYNRLVSNTILYNVGWGDRIVLNYKKQLNKNIMKLKSLFADVDEIEICCVHGEGYILKIIKSC